MNNNFFTYNSTVVVSNKKNSFLFLKTKEKKIFLKIKKYFFIDSYFKYLFFLNINQLNNLKLNYFFFSWKMFIVVKLKIRHKISWVKFFRKKYFFIKLNYGFSYNVYINLSKIFLKKKRIILKPNIMYFWNLNLDYIFYQLNLIKNIQPLNTYTMRGYRFSKQGFIKRVGKISKYTEFKSKIL